MFSYFFKGVSVTAAMIYAVLSFGISYLSAPKPAVSETVFSPSDETAQKQKNNVHILQKREDIGFALQQAFDLYSKNAQNDTEFSVQTITSSADYNSVLRAKLLAGDGADMFQISSSRELLELNKYIRPLDFLPWIEDAYPGSLDAVSFDGKIYAVPYSIEGFGFICNRDIFEKSGLNLNDIRDFDSLTEAFTELKEKINSGELEEGFPALEAVCEFPAQDNIFLSGGFADIVMSGSFKTPAETATSQSVDFPSAESSEELVKLLARHSSSSGRWPRLAEVTNAQQIERFANARVAVILQDTNVYRRINDINPELKGRVFLLPIPLKDYEQASVYMGVPEYWAINSASDENIAQTCGDFLSWLYNSSEGAEYFANQFEAVSPYREYAGNTGVAIHNQMLAYFDAGMILPQLHREIPQEWGKNIFSPNIRSYFTDIEKTWSQVIDDSAKGWKVS